MTAHDGPWHDLIAAKERDELERTAPPCAECARLEHLLAVTRAERDELDRKAERSRLAAELAGGQLWDRDCEIADLKHELEVARG